MIEQLSVEEYHKALNVFASMQEHLAVAAVLHGSAQGKVFVNDRESPDSGLILVRHRLYIAGNPQNQQFTRELHDLFMGSIFPEIKAAGQDGFVLYYENSQWEATIQNQIFEGCKIYPGPRQYYHLDLTKETWQASGAALPDGYAMRSVDRALLEEIEESDRETLVEEMLSERESVDDFLKNSFGYCIVDGRRIVTWCLSEYNLGPCCEIGIATTEGYRRRGLATLTGEAFLERAKADGYTQIGWHCWTNNLPSSASARKLGFKKISDFNSYFVPAP